MIVILLSRLRVQGIMIRDDHDDDSGEKFAPVNEGQKMSKVRKREIPVE